MSIIIETCPVCGHDLHDVMLATFPPIPKKECWHCNWSWTGEPEKVVRVPFGQNSDLIIDDLVDLEDYTTLNVDFTDKTIIGDNCTITSGTIHIGDVNFKDLENPFVSNFEQSACVNCSNNPKNGGSGVCFCTLGQMNIT